jgi:hypothetical protein
MTFLQSTQLLKLYASRPIQQPSKGSDRCIEHGAHGSVVPDVLEFRPLYARVNAGGLLFNSRRLYAKVGGQVLKCAMPEEIFLLVNHAQATADLVDGIAGADQRLDLYQRFKFS